MLPLNPSVTMTSAAPLPMPPPSTKPMKFSCGRSRSVSYTHLRAHETDSSLFGRQRQMCIRDRDVAAEPLGDDDVGGALADAAALDETDEVQLRQVQICLLYTSPSPRDGLLSIRSAASDVYKRQRCCR